MRMKFSRIPGLICGRFWEEKKSDINVKETTAKLLSLIT